MHRSFMVALIAAGLAVSAFADPGQGKGKAKGKSKNKGRDTVVVFTDKLVTRLGPAPTGYEYGLVDGDILRLAVGTRLVADAIQAIID